jgi:hypothetical protein
VKFVPVCAELTSCASVEFSSSRIADRLNEVINGRRGEQFSLTDVPAFIPRRLQRYALGMGSRLGLLQNDLRWKLTDDRDNRFS